MFVCLPPEAPRIRPTTHDTLAEATRTRAAASCMRDGQAQTPTLAGARSIAVRLAQQSEGAHHGMGCVRCEACASRRLLAVCLATAWRRPISFNVATQSAWVPDRLPRLFASYADVSASRAAAKRTARSGSPAHPRIRLSGISASLGCTSKPTRAKQDRVTRASQAHELRPSDAAEYTRMHPCTHAPHACFHASMRAHTRCLMMLPPDLASHLQSPMRKSVRSPQRRG